MHGSKDACICQRMHASVIAGDRMWQTAYLWEHPRRCQPHAGWPLGCSSAAGCTGTSGPQSEPLTAGLLRRRLHAFFTIMHPLQSAVTGLTWTGDYYYCDACCWRLQHYAAFKRYGKYRRDTQYLIVVCVDYNSQIGCPLDYFKLTLAKKTHCSPPPKWRQTTDLEINALVHPWDWCVHVHMGSFCTRSCIIPCQGE